MTRAIGLQCPATHPLTRGLVGWWLCDASAQCGARLLSLTGRHHARAFVGGATVGPGRSGAAGRPGARTAFRFEGVDDYIHVDLAATITITDGSMCCWVRPDTRVAGDFDRIIDGNFQTGCWLGRNGSTQNWGGSFNAGGGAFGAFGSAPDLSWTHVMITRVGSTGLNTCYINGTSAATYTGDTTDASISVLAFGENRTTSVNDDNHTGYADDWALWNRCLSADEVRWWYQSSRRGHPETLAWYSRRAFAVPAPAFDAALHPGERVAVPFRPRARAVAY